MTLDPGSELQELQPWLLLISLIFSLISLIVAARAAWRRGRTEIAELARRVDLLARRVDTLERTTQGLAKQLSDQRLTLNTVRDTLLKAYERMERKTRALSAFLEVNRILDLLPRALPSGKVVVIDGSNVTRLAPGTVPTVRNIQMAIEWARREGLGPVVIIDKRTYDRLDDKNLAKQLRKSDFFHVVPPPFEADEIILELAERLNAIILSNDQYSEYKQRYPRVDERRCSFMIVEGELYVLKPSAPM